jgi:DNA-binding transcriptional regulator LsrR (DeoR family)
MPLSLEHHRLLYRIARAYYVDGPTQREIACRFRLSRPKVSRLLKEGRDQGVTSIVLAPPPGDLAALEHRLETLYGLEEIRSIPRVIGVAGGAAKLEVIRAALQGRLIDVLVTDQATGAALLREAPRSGKEEADASIRSQLVRP